jgi:predicted DNA-binding transcriptional regulator AlpA
MPSSIIPKSLAELLTLSQAALLCNVSQRTYWTWCHDGTAPPSLKIGKGTSRHSRRTLEAWIAAGCPRVDGGKDHE